MKLPYSATLEEHLRLCAWREWIFGGAHELAAQFLERIGDAEEE